MTIRNDISEIVLSEEEINKINQRLGEQITKDYEGKTPIMVGLLKGSLCSWLISSNM